MKLVPKYRLDYYGEYIIYEVQKEWEKFRLLSLITEAQQRQHSDSKSECYDLLCGDSHNSVLKSNMHGEN